MREKEIAYASLGMVGLVLACNCLMLSEQMYPYCCGADALIFVLAGYWALRGESQIPRE